jgi:hypothetical protein
MPAGGKVVATCRPWREAITVGNNPNNFLWKKLTIALYSGKAVIFFQVMLEIGRKFTIMSVPVRA